MSKEEFKNEQDPVLREHYRLERIKQQEREKRLREEEDRSDRRRN
ncbi:hypothetical protein [uncultured Dokdonia sp.]|nr:hypothetical protein [uncultured Dokdonia sp.]